MLEEVTAKTPGVWVASSSAGVPSALPPAFCTSRLAFRIATRPSVRESATRVAASARTAHNSAARRDFSRSTDPKRPDAERSTASSTVSSRSSWKRLMKGRPARAVTFQSIVRTSSPGTYGRTSSNVMPRPLKALW